MTGVPPGQSRLATIYGGSGFLGRHVVRTLAQEGWRVRVACRRPDLAFHLQPLGKVGQIQLAQANLRYPDSVAACAQGSSAIINLAGVLLGEGRQSFDAVHRFGAMAVARAAKEAGAGTLIHVSAIGADLDSDSAYARSKAQGEAAVREHFPAASIVRPSIIFGPEDKFFNRFAAIARMSPVIPLFGGGTSRFQPVYVGDVAQAIARIAGGGADAGKTWELGGPEAKTFEELMRYVCMATGRSRLFVPVPAPLANAQAFALELVRKLSLGLWPDWLTMTRDQVALLQHDNVVSATAETEGRTLRGLGITPESIEAIVPSYLYRFRKTGQFETSQAV